MAPGRMRAPDTMAPNVSRMRCLHAICTCSGNALPRAEAIYRARRPVTSVLNSAPEAKGRSAVMTANDPADFRTRRRDGQEGTGIAKSLPRDWRTDGQKYVWIQ